MDRDDELNLRKLLAGQEKFVTYEHYWFGPFDIIDVFDTYEEALASTGMTQEELDIQRDYAKHSDRYDYIEIVKINLEDFIIEKIESTIDNARFFERCEMREELAAKVPEDVKKKAYYEGWKACAKKISEFADSVKYNDE